MLCCVWRQDAYSEYGACAIYMMELQLIGLYVWLYSASAAPCPMEPRHNARNHITHLLDLRPIYGWVPFLRLTSYKSGQNYLASVK